MDEDIFYVRSKHLTFIDQNKSCTDHDPLIKLNGTTPNKIICPKGIFNFIPNKLIYSGIVTSQLSKANTTVKLNVAPKISSHNTFAILMTCF